MLLGAHDADMHVGNRVLLQEPKADGMLPDQAHGTQHHQAIVLSRGVKKGYTRQAGEINKASDCHVNCAETFAYLLTERF
jgi:hypothetical protein